MNMIQNFFQTHFKAIPNPKIAVAIPCYNEEATIAKVVGDFKKVLPQAVIYVFDNNSTDQSARLAQEAGATVYPVQKRGKGNVLRTMFDRISADALVLVDGDDTYHAEEVNLLLEPVLQGRAEMVVGNRLHQPPEKSFTALRQSGNRIIVATINLVYHTAYKDILSGYRVFSRRFIESVPLLTPGFETETELTLQALEENLEILEVPISYKNRPANSSSKLRPFNDGWRIMVTAAMLLRDHHPLRFFGLIGLTFLLVALATTILKEFNILNLADLPDHILLNVTFFFTSLGVLIMGIGLILSAINTRLREIKQIMKRNKKDHV